MNVQLHHSNIANLNRSCLFVYLLFIFLPTRIITKVSWQKRAYNNKGVTCTHGGTRQNFGLRRKAIYAISLDRCSHTAGFTPSPTAPTTTALPRHWSYPTRDELSSPSERWMVMFGSPETFDCSDPPNPNRQLP